ncbi:MAG: DUF429 domain-containing protein [Desulfurococcaceae archaeon]
MALAVGIDLRGSRRRPTGLASFDGRLLRTRVAFSDEEILGFVRDLSPVAVAIDAPLSMASGYRLVDREMIRRGYRVLPPGWKGMRVLVERAIYIASELAREGYVVVETHPLSSLKSSRCSSAAELFSALGIAASPYSTKDELDAAIAALTAFYYARGLYEVVSSADGAIVLLPGICGAGRRE